LRALYASNAGDHAAELEQWIDIGKRYADMGDRRGAAIAGVNSGYGWMMVGNYEKAEATLRDVVETAGALHLLRAVGAARHNLGLVLAHRGDFEGAVREETLALEAMTAAHDDRLTATSRVYLATILEMAGDLAAAEKVGREGLLGLEQLPPLRPRALAILARIMLRLGGVAKAERRASRVGMRFQGSCGSRR
jgi:tetratricopeptide (TPR) repeat protein